MQPASRGGVSPDHEMPRILLRATPCVMGSIPRRTAPVPYQAFAYHSCLTCSNDCDLEGHPVRGSRMANRDLLFTAPGAQTRSRRAGHEDPWDKCCHSRQVPPGRRRHSDMREGGQTGRQAVIEPTELTGEEDELSTAC